MAAAAWTAKAPCPGGAADAMCEGGFLPEWPNVALCA